MPKANKRKQLEKKLTEIWQRKVKERDFMICQECGIQCGEIAAHAHHVLHKSRYKIFEWDIINGITLCYKCHCKIHIGHMEAEFLMHFSDKFPDRWKYLHDNRHNIFKTTLPNLEAKLKELGLETPQGE